MTNFHRVDQEYKESIPSFTNMTEGLLSRISEKFTEQIPSHVEQRLLSDELFHRSRKSIKDSVKC